MTDWRVFKHLVRLLTPFRRSILAAVFLGFLTIGSSMALMGTSAWLIAKAALHPSIAELNLAIVGVRFFGISRGLLRYLERLTSHHVTFRLLKNLRVWFYQQLEPLAPARLINQHSGDLLTRVVHDIDTLQNFYLRVVAPSLVAVGITIAMLIFAGGLDLIVALALLLFLIVSGVILPIVAWQSGKKQGQTAVQIRANLNIELLDGVQGMAELLIFGQAQSYFAKIQTRNQDLIRQQHGLAHRSILQSGLGNFLVWLSIGVLLWLGIPRLDEIMLAPLALVTMACYEAFLPLGSAFQNLGSSIEAGRRLMMLVESDLSSPDPASALSPSNFDITFKHVGFQYGPDEPAVLRDLNLSIPQGTHIAILGPSGVGKSTLINLLVRFWDYQAGEIQLGGHALHDYSPEALRDLIAVVPQNPHLFNATIRENLLLAQPKATEEQLETVVKIVGLDNLIASLPEGLDTWVGELGHTLSAGERQRVAIARAMLKNAPILVLDEATTNLDAVSQQNLLKTVQLEMEGRTIIFITHEAPKGSWMTTVIRAET
ncbi:MAG: thiol reductant ABC exporter subunit CydC [Chloroflexi bacterium]|nr:thiol reductant ABC exporter subunit CydC [Chloroflexota bacterium]